MEQKLQVYLVIRLTVCKKLKYTLLLKFNKLYVQHLICDWAATVLSFTLYLMYTAVYISKEYMIIVH